MTIEIGDFVMAKGGRPGHLRWAGLVVDLQHDEALIRWVRDDFHEVWHVGNLEPQDIVSALAALE